MSKCNARPAPELPGYRSKHVFNQNPIVLHRFSFECTFAGVSFYGNPIVLHAFWENNAVRQHLRVSFYGNPIVLLAFWENNAVHQHLRVSFYGYPIVLQAFSENNAVRRHLRVSFYGSPIVLPTFGDCHVALRHLWLSTISCTRTFIGSYRYTYQHLLTFISILISTFMGTFIY